MREEGERRDEGGGERGRRERGGRVYIKPLSFCASLVPMVWGPSLSMPG